MEDAHFSLFSAVVCYFASLAFILTMALRLMKPHIQHERALALQRAKARDVEITSEERRAAGRVRRREQGLGALSPSTPRVASPSDRVLVSPS